MSTNNIEYLNIYHSAVFLSYKVSLTTKIHIKIWVKIIIPKYSVNCYLKNWMV